eukprot:Nitzschia sp. Nitz4//scaffold144_size56818//22159//23376//NITZ4_006533-RA/size56818-processed-gene-0.80-mRNA-1//-1//CDS//3329536504//9126//frame0
MTDRTQTRGANSNRAKARWAILRNALLQASREEDKDDVEAGSIHRFPGYQLIRPRLGDDTQYVLFLDRTRSLTQVNVPDDVLALTLETLGGSTTSVANPSTRYQIWEYPLDSTCSLWTRQPCREATRWTIQDLVSHRKTGVDNTGNVCVWDSELTLSYMLFHHYVNAENGQNLSFGHEAFAALGFPRRILELGTGMAGLAATSLGMRVVQINKTSVEVALTDGHPDGVLNNKVNDFLTQISSWTKETPADSERNPYLFLKVSCEVLLWSPERSSTLSRQDLVLASDCVHFQNFHAALIITALRSLRLGGVAIFCQPTRADSLDNFCQLLGTKTDSAEDVPLLSLHWWNHPILTEQDKLAREADRDKGNYDPELHCPKILLISKLRELTEQDCLDLVQCQARIHGV